MNKTALYSKAFKESIHGISPSEIPAILVRLKDTLKAREEFHLYPRILKNVIASLEYHEYATITSARPLDKNMESEVVNKLQLNFPEISDKKIQFEIDEKMLGGIRISYRDFLFDGTIRGVLQKLMGSTK